MGRIYRIIGCPSILQDYHASVEILIAESAKRRSHFRFIRPGMKRDLILDLAVRRMKVEAQLYKQQKGGENGNKEM